MQVMRTLVVACLCLSLVSCASSEPLIPDSIYQEVSASDRERNYDLAWQEIARLEGAVKRGEFDNLSGLALLVTARMERLESGRPSQMGDLVSQWRIRQISERIDRGPEPGSQLVEALVADLRAAFDAGEFAIARELSTELFLRTSDD